MEVKNDSVTSQKLDGVHIKNAVVLSRNENDLFLEICKKLRGDFYQKEHAYEIGNSSYSDTSLMEIRKSFYKIVFSILSQAYSKSSNIFSKIGGLKTDRSDLTIYRTFRMLFKIFKCMFVCLYVAY